MSLHRRAVTVAGDLPLLTDPFLQMPVVDGVHVVWMTEFPGGAHVVLTGAGVDSLSRDQLRRLAAGAGALPQGIRVHRATTDQLSRVVEDAASHLPARVKPTVEEGVVARAVYRHEAVVRGVTGDTPYRVVSSDGQDVGVSATYTLAPAARAGHAQRILLTSDHQAMINTPANLQVAAETIGRIDAVFHAGDLVNQPDRASEWFDDTRGSAYFPVLQGRAGRVAIDGRLYRGAPIIQNAPLFPAIGNHEVQGRMAGATTIAQGFDNAVPREVARAAYEAVAADVNPTGDERVRERWIEDNSFSTTTYEEIFTLPRSASGGERYYAVTVGDVRLVTLHATRIWRSTVNDADPAARTATSRYQERAASLGEPLDQGYGQFIVEGLGKGSAQYAWLEQELSSPEFRTARYTVVMMHEGPHGLGENISPSFTAPVRIDERDVSGALVGVRYEYPIDRNVLLDDVQPLLEGAGVDLVYSGHSHLWNRFRSESGTVYLESSNTGNSYGAYHELSGRSRHVPAAPWDAANYLAQGNPGGLPPVVPTVTPVRTADGTPLPYVQDDDAAVFTVLDTGPGEVVTWLYDLRHPDTAPVVLDRFRLGG